MRIVQENPPNIEEIKQAFTLKKGVVFTHGDTIYSPDSLNLSPDLIAHELIHVSQQKDGPEKWWKRYLAEPAFRASQEIPAYQAQFKFVREHIKDKNRLAKYTLGLADELSGELYGSIMTRIEAYEAIRKEKLFAFKIRDVV